MATMDETKVKAFSIALLEYAIEQGDDLAEKTPKQIAEAFLASPEAAGLIGEALEDEDDDDLASLLDDEEDEDEDDDPDVDDLDDKSDDEKTVGDEVAGAPIAKKPAKGKKKGKTSPLAIWAKYYKG